MSIWNSKNHLYFCQASGIKSPALPQAQYVSRNWWTQNAPFAADDGRLILRDSNKNLKRNKQTELVVQVGSILSQLSTQKVIGETDESSCRLLSIVETNNFLSKFVEVREEVNSWNKIEPLMLTSSVCLRLLKLFESLKMIPFLLSHH